MKYPKLWPVGGHPEGEAKVRQLNKLGPKWLRASGPGWVAEKQNKLSNVKHGGSPQFYAYGWGRARFVNTISADDRYWEWGTDPLYDGMWKERTRWADRPLASFQAGANSPGVYLGEGWACDVRSTAPLDEYGNNQQFTAETKLSEVIDYLFTSGGYEAIWVGGYEAVHSTNVNLHRVGRQRDEGFDVPGFTPTDLAPLLDKRALVVGYAKHGAVSEDLSGNPEMLSPSFIVVSRNELGETVATPPAPIPISSMPDAAVGREWVTVRAKAVGPNAVCVVMQSKYREPFTELKTVDVRNQLIAAFTLDGGLSWSNYLLTDFVETLDAWLARAIGIDYEGVHEVAETHPAYGKVIYEKLGDELEYYVNGFCALPQNDGAYQALLVTRNKAIRLTPSGGAQVGTVPTAKPLSPFGVVFGTRVVGYTFEGLFGTNWIIHRHASNDGGVTWEPSIVLDDVVELPDDLDDTEVYWLGPITAVRPNLLLSTMVVASSTEGFFYRYVSVFSDDGGDWWQFAGAVTPNTPEWISAAGPAQAAQADYAFTFHRAAAYDNQSQNNGRYRWLGAQFGKIHYCGTPGRWAPYDAAIPDLLKEVP